MRIVHIISNLGIGGAELNLCSLVEQTFPKGIEHVVVSLLPGGILRPRLERAGARTIELPGKRGLAGALLLRRLGVHVASAEPDIVHGWMYHSNLAATVMRGLGFFNCPVIWSIRQGLDNFDASGLTNTVMRLGAWLSYRPEAIVYNSKDAASSHEALGYSPRHSQIIYNGVDCERFRPRPEARAKLRDQLNLPDHALLIGRVARYSPMKDFDTLLAAFRKVLDAQPAARLLLAGTDVEAGNHELASLCRRHDCAAQVILLGPRLDIEQIYPALDVHVSSSNANEGFPNVVAEALASGTLVVSTSIGESALIRQGAHHVVSPGNADVLSAAILDLAARSSEEMRALSSKGRQFIEDNFSIETFACKHADLYESLAKQNRLG
jgi:glycosyltransferase involved in cell wall biosynthesis